MSRPLKEGLDYFPLDVDIDQDDKIALIEATHGVEGFGIVIKLLMKIYDNSYFYEWGEKEQLLFAKRVNVDINLLNVIINDCLKWGLFSKEVYENSAILTSAGIQRRYLEACNRRKTVKISSKYLLLNDNEVNVYKNLVIESINEVNTESIPQRKVKESISSSSKENPFSFYQNNFGVLSPFLAENIQQWCDDLSDDLVIESMKIALMNGKDFGYAEGALKQWKRKNIVSLDDVRAERASRQRENQKKVAGEIDWENI